MLNALSNLPKAQPDRLSAELSIVKNCATLIVGCHVAA
jgi:hypothetical protein